MFTAFTAKMIFRIFRYEKIIKRKQLYFLSSFLD